jgi:2-polyprenyl-3-methyl-5-hydroxy-6-metoxy-1,4-benzoquinol methylase
MSNTKPWHESEEFWETFEPFMFGQESIDCAAQEIDDLLSLLKLKPGSTVLDLGCGIGRHAKVLARRGFKVTGVDITRKYLDKARMEAKQEGLDIAYIQDDMRKFKVNSKFDAIINLLTSGLSYFENIEEDRQVIRNACDSLKPGGLFVTQTHSKEILARIFQARTWREHDGTYLLLQRTIKQNWSWMENDYILIKDGKIFRQLISHRMYSASELGAMIKDCGFREVEAYGDFDGSPYDEKAKTMVLVGHK